MRCYKCDVQLSSVSTKLIFTIAFFNIILLWYYIMCYMIYYIMLYTRPSRADTLCCNIIINASTLSNCGDTARMLRTEPPSSVERSPRDESLPNRLFQRTSVCVCVWILSSTSLYNIRMYVFYNKLYSPICIRV